MLSSLNDAGCILADDGLFRILHPQNAHAVNTPIVFELLVQVLSSG